MRKFSWWIFALVLLISVSTMGKVLYSQDFEDGRMPDDFRIVDGIWEIEDGRLIGNSPMASVQGRVVFGPELDEFVYSVDATFLSVINDARWFSIFFRSTPTGMPPYHMFTIRQNATGSNGTELAFREPTGSWDVRRTKAYKERFRIGKTYRIKVAVTGDNFFYFIDDELMFAASEKGFRDKGIFGLHTNGCKVAFDNIVIEAYDPEEYQKYEKQVAQEMQPILPRIAAHRGNSSAVPENTLAAFQSAIDVGADMIELDVYFSKDKELVVLHDGTVDRTTNGTGSVSGFTLSELRELDAGSWKSVIYKGEKIPTLEECLLLAKDKVRVLVELKTVGTEREVLKLIDKLDMRDQVTIISFHAAAVRTFRQIAPDIPAAILIGSAKDYAEIERIAKSANTNILDLSFNLIDKQSAVYFLERGYTLWAWTVDNPAVMEQMKECGVTVLTTNVPSTALKLLRTEDKK